MSRKGASSVQSMREGGGADLVQSLKGVRTADLRPMMTRWVKGAMRRF